MLVSVSDNKCNLVNIEQKKIELVIFYQATEWSVKAAGIDALKELDGLYRQMQDKYSFQEPAIEQILKYRLTLDSLNLEQLHTLQRLEDKVMKICQEKLSGLKMNMYELDLI